MHKTQGIWHKQSLFQQYIFVIVKKLAPNTQEQELTLIQYILTVQFEYIYIQTQQ